MRSRSVCTFVAVMALSVMSFAQNRPTDEQVVRTVTAYAKDKSHEYIFKGGRELATYEVFSVKILRWGTFQATDKYWPVEVCVGATAAPYFGRNRYSIGFKMRFRLEH